MKDNIHFRIIEHKSEDYKNVVRLREEILRKPLGLTFTSRELELEKDFIHVTGFLELEVVATTSLIPEGNVLRMKQVAVRNDLQKQGIASKMMIFCESYAKENGFVEIYCHARDTAVPFYLKHKYSVEGEIFEEVNIPHLKMRKRLA